MKSFTAVRISALAAFAALSAACGTASDVGASGVPSAEVTPVPATFPEGIYAANYSGTVSGDGSPESPVKSINAAISLAQSRGLKDVYVVGGGFDGGYAEVVVLADGINLHGAVCLPAHPPLRTDVEACKTTINGGSPTMVGQGISGNTVVERFEILGTPGVQSGSTQTDYFDVPGVGCIGRGVMNAKLTACEPKLQDEFGRPMPQSSVAVAIATSESLFFRDVKIESAKGADGLPGIDGDQGDAGTVGLRGGNAGAGPTASGRGGRGAENPSCPEARGGNGGRGGRFHWDGRTWCKPKSTFDLTPICIQHDDTMGAPPAGYSPRLTMGMGFSAWSGEASVGATAGGRGKNFYWNTQKAAAGDDGINGGAGSDGTQGAGGLETIDLVTLVARSGEQGMTGFAGKGGGGGGGGAPATRLHAKRTSTSGSFSIFGVGGSGGSEHATETDAGETAGGGGGAGSAGGCGGSGGLGGQGGASSIAVYLVDAKLGLKTSTAQAGEGGRGGAGGNGGFGGEGGGATDGGDGRNTAGVGQSGSWNVGAEASFDGGSFFTFGTSSSSTEAWSPSEAGRGGRGGAGGKGGNGGVGGGGAGGASIAVMLKGMSTVIADDEDATLLVGTPGQGGGEGAAAGKTGLAETKYAISAQ